MRGYPKAYDKKVDVSKTMPRATIRLKNVTHVEDGTVKRQKCLIVQDTNTGTNSYKFLMANDPAILANLRAFLAKHCAGTALTGMAAP